MHRHCLVGIGLLALVACEATGGGTGGRRYAPTAVAPLPGTEDTSRFDNGEESPIRRVADAPFSTFSADVDTSSWSLARRFVLDQGQLPPSEAVRVEEIVNAFDYAYPVPESADEPFAPAVTVFPAPWDRDRELIRIGVKGYDLEPEETPPGNVVLLLDVSGSMNQPDKLPLVVRAMELLTDQLDTDDTLAIVLYAGAAGVALEPTPGDQKTTIKQALRSLTAGGSTAGGEGLSLAYELAEQNFDAEAVNRIVLVTDGDFNVGVTGDEPLADLVARKRETGIYLSVLGVGLGNLNDQMMQTIAQHGNGVAAYIGDLEDARRVLVREFTSSMFPIAEDLKFQVEFNPAAISEYRLIGYQTRMLREEDFGDDAKDAGDIGSGHTVTALYEVTRTGAEGRLPPRRYAEAPPAYDPDAELAFLRIRYKAPGGETSRLIERAILPSDRTDRPGADARFAAAAAALGEKLARTGHADAMSYEAIADYANAARGDDPYGDRAALVRVARAAGDLAAGAGDQLGD